MTNPNPTCHKDCRFTTGVGSRTCTYYQPIYDKHGNNTNPDMNTTTYSMSCLVCGKERFVKEQNGKTTIEEKNNAV